jgi:predicted ester cyclase
MTRERAIEFFALQQRHWDARDPEALANGHTEDGQVISPIFRTIEGRPAILSSYRTLFQIFPDWRYTGERVLVDGEQAAQSFTVTASHVGEFMGFAGTGRRTEFSGVRLLEMRDGLIAREQRYYDFTGLLMQLGILHGKPGRS